MKPTVLLLIFFLAIPNVGIGQPDNSVLASGDWYKLAVLEKGIYKIDHSFLASVGISVGQIDPRNIAIYGNGGNGMLPQPNAADRPEDLQENAIYVEGENDGSFDSEDYILFYGNSPDYLKYDTESGFFNYEKNLYSDTTFYFLTIKQDAGKRISDRESAGSDLELVTTFKDVFVHEKDDNNITLGGRRWFGEEFYSSQPDHTFKWRADNIAPSSTVDVLVSLMAQSEENSSFESSLNGNSLGEIPIDDTPDEPYIKKGDDQVREYQVDAGQLVLTDDSLELSIHYNAPPSRAAGYLDYAKIEAHRQLVISDNYYHFYNTSGLSSATLQLSNATSDLSIWNTTNPTNPVNQEHDLSGNTSLFGIGADAREFIAFRGSSFPSPIFSKKIASQDLHGLSAPDAIFITHTKFLTQANKLKNHRENMVQDFKVHVVTVDQIYNEFSSGMQDVTALRDFIRHLYLKNPEKLKYVLLFGDCSYDYKDRTITKTNYVPVYEARYSLHPLFNFSSDDYYGFMEENEGEWIESKSGDHTMELGVGRLPVKNTAEAEDVVGKIIRYETSRNSFGKWRNEVLFIADDGDNNIHQRDADLLANYVEDTRNEFNVDKLFIDAYQQLGDPLVEDSQSSPEARLAFEEAVEQGKLMINYTGHGREDQLTDEKIIDDNQIEQLTNRSKLPFFITATCEFGNYDNPELVSGGEKALLNPNGGAIALLTTTRPVYSNTNFILNEAYYYAAMKKENGQFPRLGDIIRNTKNNSLAGAKNRNFALLGDPTMSLTFPKYELAVTSVNGKVIEMADTLKALSKITIGGEVRNFDKTVIDDFSGKVSVTVFDKATSFSTFGNENTNPAQYTQRNSMLFNGEASVEDGYFSFEFVVPKNISYVFGEGKLSMYALNNQRTLDANGATIDLKVGGSNPNAPEDNTPPEIALYMGDSTFVSGQAVGTSPLFLAKLSDENGINISNQGFGQNITMTLNDGAEIVLNEFYSASLDTYQSGWVSYPLHDLEPGNYTITLTAYDTYNNATEQEIEFIVTDEVALKLSGITAFPNPISLETDEISFTFSHDREGEELLLQLQIINLQGRVISESQYRFDDSSSELNSIVWDGKDAHGNRPEKGIYIYKMSIQSTLDGAKNQAHGKLVVLN